MRTVGTRADGREGGASEDRRRAELGGEVSLRSRVARGTIVNGAYHLGLNGLLLVRGFAAAALLSTTEFGIWGILAVTLGTFLALRQIGLGEKFVQQDELDQEGEFKRAFSVDLLLTIALTLLMAAAVPLLSLAYGEPEMLVPGLVLVLALPAFAFQSPIWVYYRRLQFGRQRLLQSVDPVLAFVVTVVLAAVGFGYWSLVIGAICGAWGAALVSIAFAPYRLGLSLDRDAIREYGGFSLPLLGAALSTLIAAQATLIVADRALGLAAAGVVYLVITISFYVYKMDEVVITSIYPAICAVRERIQLVHEAFLKSNRFAMLWGFPFGVGLALFAGDLVEFALGEKWRLAEEPLRIFGLIAAANQIGFNWNAFMQAMNRTIPIAYSAATALLLTGAVALPLLALEGVVAFSFGMALVTLILIAQRLYFLRSVVPLKGVFRAGVAAALPSAIAAGPILSLRAVDTGGRDPLMALAELGVFVALVLALTLVWHRHLMGEMVGYVRAGASAPAAVPQP